MQDGGRLWQPYTDFLVTSALLAVPWGGPEMAESAPNDVQQLLASARSYQQARPRQMQQALRPLPTLDPASPDDLTASCDSGGASRLIQVRTEYHHRLPLSCARQAPCASCCPLLGSTGPCSRGSLLGLSKDQDTGPSLLLMCQRACESCLRSISLL